MNTAKNDRHWEKTNFTLIELLIVIAIIAILASLLLPALKSAIERGRQSQCVSNMKTFGVNTLQYAMDWNEWYPAGNKNLNRQETLLDFYPKQLAVYYGVKENTLATCCSKYLSCPAETGEALSDANKAKFERKYIISNYQYTTGNVKVEDMSGPCGGVIPAFQDQGQKTVRQVTDNSIIAVEVFVDQDNEATDRRMGFWKKYVYWQYFSGDETYKSYNPSFAHNNANAYLFKDGHTAVYKRNRLNSATLDSNWRVK